jgi:DNA-binding NtrC family response regulator
MGKAAVRSSHKGIAVLVVEDDERLRFGMCGALRELGFHVVEAASCASAAAALGDPPDVIVTDFCLPDGDALELLPKLRRMAPDVPIFIVTGYGTIDRAVRAVKEGAEDFLTKPIDVKALGAAVQRAAEKRERTRTGPRVAFQRQPSKSLAMRRLDDEVAKLRDADCAVLILGETGTGKSTLARRIHDIGARRDREFVDVNCAGLSREFFETELFGHERGAFTGALANKTGLLDAADGGTLFLDEVGELDLQVQPKLLKVLEEKRFRPMGAVKERSVDVRLMIATNADLGGAVADGRFRADLYYRISTVVITMPSLRERIEDLAPIARSMLDSLGGTSVEIGDDALERLRTHAWPGNLRELKNVLERTLLFRASDLLHTGDLRFDTTATKMRAVSAAPSARTLVELERDHIIEALVAERGRVEAAARRLGIPRSTLYQRIKLYGINAADLRKA